VGREFILCIYGNRYISACEYLKILGKEYIR